MKRIFIHLFIVLALVSGIHAQRNVMWEPVNISQMDLFDGPGGDAIH